MRRLLRDKEVIRTLILVVLFGIEIVMWRVLTHFASRSL